MKKEKKRFLRAALGLLTAFLLWTLAVCFVDVQPIGPRGTSVGLAALNGSFHALTGVHWALYVLTDWLSLVPIFLALMFALLGLVQWMRGKSLRAVDRSLLVLGGFYVLLAAAYVCFEVFPVNYRPVLVDGVLEASYPSSTTILAIGIMSTSDWQLRQRIRKRPLRGGVLFLLRGLAVLLVLGRLLSGVHWLSDIIGGALLSGGLVALYAAMESM